VLWGTQEDQLDQSRRSPHLGHTLALQQKVPLVERPMQQSGVPKHQHPRLRNRNPQGKVVDWPRHEMNRRAVPLLERVMAKVTEYND
jgi:hypothetical protein